MTVKSDLAIAIASTIVLATASGAHAITYVGNALLGDISARYSITTDGTLGVINSSNITAFDILLSSPVDVPEIDSSNAFIKQYSQSNLTATTTSLSYNFDYSRSSYVLFDLNSNTSDFGFSTGSVYVGAGSLIGAVLNDGTNFDVNSVKESGNKVIATVVSAVPEPSVWIVMLGGIAMMGAALRFGRKRGVVALAA